ncbi:ribonuclease E/G [Altererythrobacter lutimaris]|uniref:Ribonuclease E/G n=1 Tax=Altererythrobacter lutimaris TaxID=2743979 RepID=A0A850HBE7_9SPHN|nr:ribonuclease E/G [Altererythrobacter lutimaris]NVE94575.1 ribonuclease E/G [Altererythrobacter lutimaris]
MAEWLIEDGIGERRALLVDGEDVLAAKLIWPGELAAGELVDARLTSKTSGARRGLAVTGKGQELLVDHLPADVTEGETIKLTVTRAPIAERGRFKHAQGRVVREAVQESPLWLEQATTVRAFSPDHWDEIWHTASSGEVAFDGGSLLFSVTPAMTLIDVDGEGSPRDVALAAVPAIARWLSLFDLGGNIGIDFPTIEAKTDRKAVDSALADALDHWPHERTAMNGFGFVQLVARLEGPSLLHRFATSRTGMCARMALRQAERASGNGNTLLLRVHPALKAKLKPDWIDELVRRSGRKVEIETDPGLALETPQAQIIDQ